MSICVYLAISVLVAGYLLGSINFAALVARSHGIDILKVGSGNPGATNITRALGSKWGKLVFVLDALKGYVAAYIPFLLDGASGPAMGILALIAAILGHSFSVFLRFRGGKGVATTMGGLLALMPIVLLMGLVVWGLIYVATRTVALASLMFAVSLSLSAFCLHGGSDLRFWLGLALGFIIVVRHRSNIIRMFQGTESKFKNGE